MRKDGLRDAAINRRTAERYEALLEALFLVESIPAWTTNRLKRQVLRPKWVVVDTGLWGSIVGADTAGVLADGDLLGRLLETFVVSQLRADLPRTPTRSSRGNSLTPGAPSR